MEIKKLNLTLKRILVFFIIMLCLVFFDYLGFFESSNNYLYDLFFRLRGTIECSKDIVLINIDDKTLERTGGWPIKRVEYARLIEKAYQSHAIFFDIIMAESTQDDDILGEAIKRQGRVFLPVLITEDKEIKYPSVLHFPEYLGHIYIEQDMDGIVRNVYHTLTVNNKSIPSITSVLYEHFTKTIFKREEVKKGHTAKKRDKILQSDRMRINYVGGHGSFVNISFIDVIDGVYPNSFFKDRIIFVGLTATGTFDTVLTPFLKDRRGMSGIEVQANIFNTLIFHNAIADIHTWLKWLIAFIVAISAFILFMKLDEKNSAFLGFFFIIFIFTGSYCAFSIFHIWSSPAIFSISILFVFVISYVFKFEDAAKILRDTYTILESHLRWKLDEKKATKNKKDNFSMLTKRGLYWQAEVLTEVGRQLNFEKELTDKALLTDLHGVMLFDQKENILMNDFVRNIFNTTNINTHSLDGFINSITAHLFEKITPHELKKRLIDENGGISYTLALAEKNKKFYKVDFSPLRMDDKRYHIVFITDITKIKELELLKSHIISIVSHELKSPMTSIQGFSEILSNNLTGKMQDFAKIINKESERLVRFLNTFLDITRIEEGRQSVKIEPVNLIVLVKEVSYALKPIGDANRITIHEDVPEKMEDIMIDKDLTKQCIFNLVENAIKYSPPERDVIIRLKDEPDIVKIDVVDHGYGIKKEDMERIFDKFFRSTNEKTKNIKGSGLGLTFVKEAVELQGGRLTMKSRYNEGSTFSILFPKK